MQSKRIVKIVEVVCLSVFALFVSGCGGAELENKTFPLAVLIAQEDGQHKICYLAQQLSEVSNERADGGNMTAANASGKPFLPCCCLKGKQAYFWHTYFHCARYLKMSEMRCFPKTLFGK